MSVESNAVVLSVMPDTRAIDENGLPIYFEQGSFFCTIAEEKVLWYPQSPYPRSTYASIDERWKPIVGTSFRLLDVLGARAGSVVTYGEIAKSAWDDDNFEFTSMSSIRIALAGLRNWLGPDELGHPTKGAIRLIRGVGLMAEA